jgi:hypothetical protein
MSEAEVKMLKELKSIKETLKSFEKQIKDVSLLLNQSDLNTIDSLLVLKLKSFSDLGTKTDISKDIQDFKYNEDELKTMRDLMRNE